MRELLFPDLNKTRRVDGHSTHILMLLAIAMLFSQYFFTKAGMNVLFRNGTVQWMDKLINKKQNAHRENSKNFSLACEQSVDWMDSSEVESMLDAFSAEMHKAKHEKVDAEDVAKGLNHLNEEQQIKLQSKLDKFETLFDGKLGSIPHQQVHLEAEERATPVHTKSYGAPKAHEEAFKKELQHLIQIGVLRPCGPAELASPTFVIPGKPNKDGAQTV